MQPIHVVAKLMGKLSSEDLSKIKRKAVEGFIIEPDPAYEMRWKQHADRLINNLKNQGQIEKAEALHQLQEKMCVHRQKTLHCTLINTPSDESEFVVTDGINVGRFSFRIGTAIVNAWVDGIEHDVYVVRRMLTSLCEGLLAENVMIEGSGRYKAWLEKESNSFPAIK